MAVLALVHPSWDSFLDGSRIWQDFSIDLGFDDIFSLIIEDLQPFHHEAIAQKNVTKLMETLVVTLGIRELTWTRPEGSPTMLALVFILTEDGEYNQFSGHTVFIATGTF